MPPLELKVFRTIIDAALAFLSRRIDGATDRITKAIEKSSKETAETLSSQNTGNAREIAKSVARLEAAVAKIKDPKFTGSVKVDMSSFKRETQDIVRAVKAIDIKTPDLSGIERGLKMLLDKADDHKEVIAALQNLQATLEKKEIMAPKTVKLDEQQMRALTASQKYGGGGIGTPQVAIKTPVMANVSMTTANTEYNYTFPSGVVRWNMKLRAQNEKFTYAWATGTMPTSGDGSAYLTVPQNFLHSTEGVDYGGKTIYFQSDAATQVMEIESFSY